MVDDACCKCAVSIESIKMEAAEWGLVAICCWRSLRSRVKMARSERRERSWRGSEFVI